TDHERAQRANSGAGDRDLPSAPASELITVAPGRELRPLRRADANERRSVAQLGEANIVGRHALARVPKQLLRRLDRFPPVLERREVPSLATRTYDPQPSFRRVEREPLPDGKGLEGGGSSSRPVATA